MNRRSVVICLMTMLFSFSTTIAAGDPLLKGKNSSAGNSQVPNTRIRLQEYSNDIPQNGNYYEWDGSKWQRYKGAIPQQGSYLKEVKHEENVPETQEAK